MTDSNEKLRKYVFRECEVVYRRRTVEGAPPGITRQINSSDDVYRIMGPLLRDNACESLWSMLIGQRNHVHALHEIAKGGAAHVAATPVDIVRAAIVANASAIIMVHNHPSGVTEASTTDLAFTERVCEIGNLLGISILDHVIIGD